MKLYFCDLCNESVPHGDLEKGKAFIRKSRVVCASCDEAMSAALKSAEEGKAKAAPGSAPSSQAPQPDESKPAESKPAEKTPEHHTGTHRRRRAASLELAALWIAVIALLLSAGTAWYALDELRRYDDERIADARDNDRANRERLRAADRKHTEARARLQTTIEAVSSALAAEKTTSKADLTKLEEALTAAKDARDALVQQLAIQKEDVGQKVSLQDGQLAELDAELSRYGEELRFFSERLNELEVQVLTGDFIRGAEDVVAAAPSKGAAWASILPDLKSAESGDRWAAVQALGETKDPEVVPHLIPILQDEDIFVRMATARVLGDLKARPAIPHLIDRLEDAEVAVQEAAVGALRTISGRNFGFEIEAPERERSKRVKAWRAWWEKEAEKDAPVGE